MKLEKNNQSVLIAAGRFGYDRSEFFNLWRPEMKTDTLAE